ncbi:MULTISPECIES: dihydroneopterin aldolase [unclassified Paenibacillus]|uniref:dihydroneopterin aldolase n=1 Tax=unclassified Paenibacillus TaxID=185978 RepID=UPI001C1041F8|nr:MULTISPECIES: dihydroneopterin aldolase [unclassified Paenibacillus]MBU5445622.1 dihydroneopterin aldolase [Paenibacillus sp. MSJ-34]
MDKMTLTRMEFFGYHGVFEEERKLGQRFYVDLDMMLDLSRAGRTDDLTATVNYAEVFYTVQNIVEKQSFQLIETLSENIASAVLDTYTIIDEITVRVTKPHPPFNVHFQGVTVEIRRKRK